MFHSSQKVFIEFLLERVTYLINMECISSFSTQKDRGNPNINKSTIWSEERRDKLKIDNHIYVLKLQSSSSRYLGSDQGHQRSNLTFQMEYQKICSSAWACYTYYI